MPLSSFTVVIVKKILSCSLLVISILRLADSNFISNPSLFCTRPAREGDEYTHELCLDAFKVYETLVSFICHQFRIVSVILVLCTWQYMKSVLKYQLTFYRRSLSGLSRHLLRVSVVVHLPLTATIVAFVVAWICLVHLLVTYLICAEHFKRSFLHQLFCSFCCFNLSFWKNFQSGFTV